MREIDFAVVGSGIGGSLFSAINSDKDLVVFERDKNLGGCASTFKRFGSLYNAGATTFVGYEDNHIIKKMFDSFDFKPDIIESEVAIRIIQEKKVIDRTADFEGFLEQINMYYPHKNNRVFWQKIKEIDETFWQIKNVYFSKYSLKAYKNSASFIFEILKKFGLLAVKNAKSFINDVLFDISKEYQDFIDSQLLITVQTTSKNISLLSLALGLSYPFHKVFYANKGMGNLIEGILQNNEVKNKEEIQKIIKERDFYRLISSKDEYLVKNIVLNSTVFDSKKLFDDEKIKSYYDKFSFSDQSAFVLYLNIKIEKDYLHHYQVILKDFLPNAISNSFFVSFSDINDKTLSKKDYSVTISTHTKASFWEDLSKEEYEKQKMITQDFILKELKKNLNISDSEITNVFSGTSKTFNRYISRSNCGGKPINLSNILELPSCTTPFKGLYNVGDTIFAGQGWPGVALGVNVLNKEIND